MSLPGLAFDNSPAIHIPFRFFNTAPWMGVAAALVLLVSAETAFTTQWTPALLAVTHLFTLGFMVMIMIGALFQVIPVITGETIPYGQPVATIVHLLLGTGTGLLVAGFATQHYPLFWYALPLLALCFISFLTALGSLLVRGVRGGDSIFCIRLAALCLLTTIVIGVLRAAQYTWVLDFPLQSNITYLHMAWGLLGWALLLVMGVGYQVIPMFHITPNYPSSLARALPSLVFFLLIMLSVPALQALWNGIIPLLLAVIMTYASFSLWLLTQRKRKIVDITVDFWRLAMVNLILAALLFATVYFSSPGTPLSAQFNIAIGVLAIYGFACSVIMGMLQKIIPFLIYMHLQKRCIEHFELLKTLPHMKTIIPVSRSKWQFRLHCIALGLLFLASLQPQVTMVAAVAAALDFCWLGFTVAMASWLYRQTATKIAVETAGLQEISSN